MRGVETLAWQPTLNATGYLLLRDGKLVARAGAGATLTRFSVVAGSHTLEVRPVFEKPPTTTTTPTTTTVPSGNVLFTGDYETGSFSQWTWGAQCANTGVPSALGTLTIQSQVVGQGRYAAQFDLPAAASSNSCETLDKRTINVGTDDYYGLMVRLPTNWQEPSGWGMSLAQFNFQGIWGSPVQLIAHADHVSLIIQSGLCNPLSGGSPGCAYSSGIGGNVGQISAIPAPVALGVWHELVVHVHWATDTSGVVEVWHRLVGGTWVKTVTLTGYPTVQWTAAQGPSGIVGMVTADKAGAYRGGATFPLTVWEDGFVRASAFSAAAAALP